MCATASASNTGRQGDANLVLVYLEFQFGVRCSNSLQGDLECSLERPRILRCGRERCMQAAPSGGGKNALYLIPDRALLSWPAKLHSQHRRIVTDLNHRSAGSDPGVAHEEKQNSQELAGWKEVGGIDRLDAH